MESLGDREVSRGDPRMSHESCSEGILNLGDSCQDLPSSPFAEYLTLDSHLEAHNHILPHPWPPTIQVAMKGPPLQPRQTPD